MFHDVQARLNFEQHKKKFTCEALVVVALKKKLKTFNHFFQTFSRNYSNFCTNPVNFINNTIYKQVEYDHQLKNMKSLLAGCY